MFRKGQQRKSVVDEETAQEGSHCPAVWSLTTECRGSVSPRSKPALTPPSASLSLPLHEEWARETNDRKKRRKRERDTESEKARDTRPFRPTLTFCASWEKHAPVLVLAPFSAFIPTNSFTFYPHHIATIPSLPAAVSPPSRFESSCDHRWAAPASKLSSGTPFERGGQQRSRRLAPLCGRERAPLVGGRGVVTTGGESSTSPIVVLPLRFPSSFIAPPPPPPTRHVFRSTRSRVENDRPSSSLFALCRSSW